jgi:hypothetical protein
MPFEPTDIDFFIEDMSHDQLRRLRERLMPGRAAGRATGFQAPPQAVAANLATPVQAGVVEIEYLQVPPVALNATSLVRAVTTIDVNIPPGGNGDLPILTGVTLEPLASGHWFFFGELYYTRSFNADTSGISAAMISGMPPVSAVDCLFHADGCATVAGGNLQRTPDNQWGSVTTPIGPLWTGACGWPGPTGRFAVSIAATWSGSPAPTTIVARLVEPGGVQPATLCAGSWMVGILREP